MVQISNYICSMIQVSDYDRKLLKREERLRSKKEIGILFRNDESCFVFPFKIFTRLYDKANRPSTSLLVTVSKKNFKNATDRNRIKRMMREAWRLQKKPLDLFLTSQNKHMDIALIYTAKEMLDSNTIHHKINMIIQRFLNQYAVHS